MARRKNELSATQLDEPLYESIKAQIRGFGTYYLGTIGNVCHTTLTNYLNGLPINPKKEDELFNVLEKAEQLKREKQEANLTNARKVVKLRSSYASA